MKLKKQTGHSSGPNNVQKTNLLSATKRKEKGTTFKKNMTKCKNEDHSKTKGTTLNNQKEK
jgi:hypothetical protein